jgi:hypothetical protein
VRTAKGRPARAHARRIISAHRCETVPAPLVCLPSLFRRSGFGYEGRESGVTMAFFNPPIKDLVAILQDLGVV